MTCQRFSASCSEASKPHQGETPSEQPLRLSSLLEVPGVIDQVESFSGSSLERSKAVLSKSFALVVELVDTQP